ncbi:hypothetical protein [Bradyrhizobium sp. RDM4]|uniref:hypothetical protein n=1 Tax=Bradyrhizobium sp. RDM4 TaxID=3378765 RepID=UPI0038FCC0B7
MNIGPHVHENAAIEPKHAVLPLIGRPTPRRGAHHPVRQQDTETLIEQGARGVQLFCVA